MKTQLTSSERRWKLHRKVAFLVGLCTTYFSARSALADQIWAQFYDGFGGNNVPYAVVVDSGGNVIVTGSSKNLNGNDDFYTAKYSAQDGHLLWSVRHTGPYGGDARGTGIAVDGQDNVVVTGYSYDPTACGANCMGFDFYTAKYEAGTGNLLWERLGPPGPYAVGGPEPLVVKKVIVDGNGNVAITGSADYGGFPSFYTAKLDGLHGQPLWEKYYFGAGHGGPDGDWPRGFAMDAAGNLIVTGSSSCCASYPTHEQLYTVKYAALDGSVIWDHRYDSGTGGDDQAMDVTVDKSGNVFVLGVTFSPSPVFGSPFNTAYYISKYAAADGTSLWEQHSAVPIGTDGAGKDAFTAQRIVVDSAGNAIVDTANSNESPTGAAFNNLVKYGAADGHVLWSRLFSLDGCVRVFPDAIALDAADNLIASGGDDHSRLLTGKYDPNGNLLWRQESIASFSPFTKGAVAVDAMGDAIIAFCSPTVSGNLDYTTVKYLPSGTTPPASSISCPANIAVGTDSGLCSAVVNYAAPVFVGNCGSTLSVICSPPSGSVFPKGRTTVTCTAGDGSTCSFTVTVNDTQPPSISCPANVSIGCSVNALAPATFAATASDNCDPNPAITYSIQPGSGFPVGTTPVTCTATDSSGNQSSCTFNVTRAALGFTGFLSPIGGADATGGSFSSPVRTFKVNSTIPVKFTSDCGGSPVLSGVHRLEVIQYTSQTNADPPIDATPTDAATTGDEFKLNGSQWQFNLDTKATGMTAGIWLLQAALSDGSQHTAWIQIK